MESAAKYVELMKKFKSEDQEDEALMTELDILWHAALRDKEAAKLVTSV
jgi:hypothetical protein